jgi:LysM repeat protein
MTIKIGHASLSEDKSTGWDGKAQAGDQTKKEVCTRKWYDGNWDYVLRAKDSKVAEKMAKTCEAGCTNDLIGYDQSQRLTLNDQAKKVGYDLSKIKTACECDCSAFMCVCALSAGINVEPSLRTATMKQGFDRTGAFNILTDKKYLTSDKYLKRGDILVRAGVHTVMALEDGSEVKKEVVKPAEKPVVKPVEKSIKAGDKLTYTGKVYSNSNGGNTKVVKNRTVYVRQVLAKGNYPILVSATQYGIGIGWVSTTMLGAKVSTPVPVSAKVYYTVKRGDTLGKIAKAHGTTVDKLASLNSIKNVNLIAVGQKIRVR